MNQPTSHSSARCKSPRHSANLDDGEPTPIGLDSAFQPREAGCRASRGPAPWRRRERPVSQAGALKDGFADPGRERRPIYVG
jgi:hypothetical protein